MQHKPSRALQPTNAYTSTPEPLNAPGVCNYTGRVPTFKMQGSKARIAEWTLNQVSPGYVGRWIEPFAGRANIALRLLAERGGYIGRVCLNDKWLTDFHTALRDYRGDFGFVPLDTINRATFEFMEGKLKPFRHEYALAQAYTCFQGSCVEWAGSSINSTSSERGNCHNGQSTINRFERAGALLRSVPTDFGGVDAFQFLQDVNPGLCDVVYCDPPYLADKTLDYPYPNVDHVRLCAMLQACPGAVYLAGYDNAVYRRLLTPEQGWNRVSVLRGSTATKGRNNAAKDVVEDCLWIKPPALQGLTPEHFQARQYLAFLAERMRGQLSDNELTKRCDNE
jgi:site-specific DNA-adenine methylase